LTPVDDFVEGKLGKYEYGKKLGGGHAHLIEPTALRRWALGGRGRGRPVHFDCVLSPSAEFLPKTKKPRSAKEHKKK